MFSVEEGGFFVDEFEVSDTISQGEEVEVIGFVAVGECADGLDAASGGPAVPGVDVVVGVVGHEGQCTIFQRKDGDAVGFAQEGAGGDAATLHEDVVREDGEVLREEGVLGVVVGELVEAASAAFGVEDAVSRGDGGDVSGADAAVVDDARGGGREWPTGGLEDPFAVLGAELA